MENDRILFAEASGGEIKKVLNNSARHKKEIYKNNQERSTCVRIENLQFPSKLLGKLFIFRTIFQPWALPSYIPAAERGLFTKYNSYTILINFTFNLKNAKIFNISKATS